MSHALHEVVHEGKDVAEEKHGHNDKEHHGERDLSTLTLTQNLSPRIRSTNLKKEQKVKENFVFNCYFTRTKSEPVNGFHCLESVVKCTNPNLFLYVHPPMRL